MPFSLGRFSCPEAPIQWWTEVVRADGHPCLAPSLREKASSLLLLIMMKNCGFFINAAFSGWGNSFSFLIFKVFLL